MTFAIKRLRPGDEALFANIADDVFDAAVEPARLAIYLSSPGHMMVAAMLDGLMVGQCAGVIHCHIDKAAELYVDDVGSASTHRRQGIAAAMLTELFEWSRELGCEEAWLATEHDNDVAKTFYRGFSPIEDASIQFYLFKL